MPDLNALLRWSIANSASQTSSIEETDSETPENSATQLSLRFRPSNPAQAGGATTPTLGGGNSAATLHPSDPYYRRPITPQAIIDDFSPASTPGPATPQPGETVLPNGGTGLMADAPAQAHSHTQAQAAAPPRSDLTSEMLDLIMGKSDSMIMKEKMEIACDESKDVDERVGALDDFEMLIELIDNANNMAILKLWEPIRQLLVSPHQDIVRHAAWICGTAVQNNLKAQAALYIHNVFPVILSIIYPDNASSVKSQSPSSSSPSNDVDQVGIETPNNTATRAKATYALSSALKHWPLASSALSSNHQKGYQTLLKGVQDPVQIIRRKMAFLIGTLVLQSSEVYTGEIPNEVKNLIEANEQEQAQAQAQVQGQVDSQSPQSHSITSSSPPTTNTTTTTLSQTSTQTQNHLLQGLKSTGILSALLLELKVPREEVDVDVEFEENAMRALISAYDRDGLDAGEKKDLLGVWTKWGPEGRESRGLGGEDGVEIGKVFRGGV